jgi:predicted dehydrogenase
MGRRHIHVIKALNHKLVGVCDQKPGALKETALEFSLSENQLFADAQELVSKTQPECVIIATTAPSHLRLVALAVNHGASHILCEKPMAVSLLECDQMIDLCQQKKVRLGVNHPMRYMEHYKIPKRMLFSESFGGFCSVAVVAGNFGMAMNGTHYFEMFRFLSEEEPREVTAWFSPNSVPNPRGAEFRDCSGSLRLLTPKGKRFHLEVGEDQGHGLNVLYAGRNGQIFIDELGGGMTWMVREEQHRSLPTTRYGMPCIQKNEMIPPTDVIEPTKAVLNELITGTDWPDGKTGRLPVAILVAAHVSNEKGNIAISLDSHLPQDRVFPWA